MPVSLGTRPQHGFDQPLGLLSDCHRRIEHFLGTMIRVLELSDGRRDGLTPQEREASEAALRYFDVAAPRHTQDEEQSLFPRLRQSNDPNARSALARIEALEADHRRADQMHAQSNGLCRRWLEGQPMQAADFERLVSLLRGLSDMYARHIALEDTELFPVAARALNRRQLLDIGQEMAQRRGLSVRSSAG